MSEKPKTVSVGEFKHWLSGVLDFQPDDWVPDAAQWGKIRDKIDQLDSGSVAVEKPPVINRQTQSPQPATRHPRPVGPLDDQERVVLPDAPIPKEQHVKVKQTGTPKIIEGEGMRVFDTGKVHEMGMIDTSEKDYESSFK